MSIEAGQQLLHYRVIEKIGEGGMGEVWKAEDTKLGREVALKFLTASFAGDAERLARFEREAKLLATLNHANIATLHGFEEAAGERFLVLELVGGEGLDQRLQRGPLPVDEVLTIGRQVAEALDAAHEAGIVHRDLKPANIRITDDKVVKVLDFGLAKVWGPDAVSGDPAASPTLTHQMTQAGVILGTAAYMSPEQARGRATDKRTDIWSFGCVLHELLSGRNVFAGDTVSDTIASVLKSEPDDAALPAETPPRLRELLARCLEKDPRRRLRDIGDARVELEKVAAGDTGVAAPTSSAPLSRWLALAAMLVLGFVLGALLQGWRMGKETAGAGTAGVKRLSVLPPKGMTVRWFDLSQDGQTLVYAAGDQGAEGEDLRLYQRRLDSFESTPIPESENPMWAAISPDGDRVAFQTDNDDGSYSVKKASLAGGPVVELLALSESPGDTGANWWSEDELLVIIDNRRTLARLSANGGAPTPVLALDNPGRVSLWGGVSVLKGGQILLLNLLEDSTEGILFRTESLDPETDERRTILADGWLFPYRDAALVYRKGTTFAVPFDHDRLEITGPEIPLWEDRGFRTRADSLAYIPRPSAADRLVHVDRSGAIEPLADAPDGRLVDLRRSPDGRQIALLTFDRTRVRRNLWRFDVARELMHPVPAADAWKGSLAWTAESDGLLYSMAVEGVYKVGRHGLRSGEAWEPYFPDWTEATGVARWAADGSVMAFVSRDPAGEKMTLWLVPAGEGAQARAFLATQSQLNRPTISPDGRLIVFSSMESGSWEIYVAAITSGSARPDLLQVSERGGTRAIWSPDGTELFFHDPAGYLMSARVKPGAAVPSFERPEVVLDLNALDLTAVYDVAPDGSGFVFAKRAAEDRELGAQIFVELGWASEFDALIDRP